jgi:oligopeptidase B
MPHDLDNLTPSAPRQIQRRELHGTTWTDEYAWMSDHDDPRLMDYLRAERAYYDSATRHLADLSNELFGEVRDRLIPTDESVRNRRGDFFYYTRSVHGSEYDQFLSSRDRIEPGRVILDENELAAGTGHKEAYVALGGRHISPDGRLLAYAVDTTGDEVYALRFRDLTPDRDLTVADDLGDVVARSYYGGAWSQDSGTFFYTVHDRTYRPYQVWRHRIGTPVSTDQLVLTEADARYELTVRNTRSGEYVVIETASRDTSETWLIPADDPTAAPAVVEPRRRGVEYRVDHGEDRLFIVTNDGAEEYRLMSAPVHTPARPHWIELEPARPRERLHACHAFAGHLVLELRRDGFALLRIVDRTTGVEREVHAEIPAGRVVLHPLSGEDSGLEYSADSITVKIDSLTEPPRWYEVDLATGARTLRKLRAVVGYDPTRYRTERRHAPAADGTLVPVTLAWRADTPLDGTAPCVMWGYGAYESCDDPSFDEGLACLLDRGVVYALTHPRGGGELGRRWWLDGRLARKVNTFSDHIAVADWLAGENPLDGSRIVDGSRIGTRGLSAGGLLQAAVAAMRPDRWRAVVAEVPFVDVVNTMLDPSIPLTVNEWDEWGDPREPEAFASMRAYSPYDNVVDGGRRPALLVTAAVHDPRVMVHEPATGVARMRSTAAAGDGVLLLRTELGTGAHTGPAGRYAHYRYESEIYAFLLDQLM